MIPFSFKAEFYPWDSSTVCRRVPMGPPSPGLSTPEERSSLHSSSSASAPSTARWLSQKTEETSKMVTYRLPFPERCFLIDPAARVLKHKLKSSFIFPYPVIWCSHLLLSIFKSFFHLFRFFLSQVSLVSRLQGWHEVTWIQAAVLIIRQGSMFPGRNTGDHSLAPLLLNWLPSRFPTLTDSL